MEQYATPEEGRNLESKVAPEEEKGVKDITAPKKATDGFVGSSAFTALAAGLSKQSVAWGQKFIAKLNSQDEIERLRAIEMNHPKHEGGRKGIIGALDARSADLDPTTFKEPEAKEETAESFDCPEPECEFTAGSEEGLEAHVVAVHDL